MINVIIADGHPVMVEGIKANLLLDPGINIMATTGSGKQLLKILENHQPDVLLMDLIMQDMGGLEVAWAIRRKRMKIKILVFSQLKTPWLMKRSISAGAKAYIIKNVSREQLIDSVYQVYKGGFEFFVKAGEKN